MKKNNGLVIVSILFALSGIGAVKPHDVQAAVVGYVRIKGKQDVRLYNKHGKHSAFYAKKKTTYAYSTSKMKLGKTKQKAYKLGNNSHWILAKNVKKVFVKAKIHLPKDYTRAQLLSAYNGRPSKAFVKASMKGMVQNDFSRTKAGESKLDDVTAVNPDKLTSQQQARLTAFALRLINDARRDLGLNPWVKSSAAQKLADRIAAEYHNNGKSIKTGHYIAGIVRACAASGLKLDDNYVEDMAGFASQKQLMTITALKKDIYFTLKQMMFGYTGSGESQERELKYYQEWEHAGDLFNTQGSLHDGDYDYFGFSISVTDQVYTLHYIGVASFIVGDPKYNLAFKP